MGYMAYVLAAVVLAYTVYLESRRQLHMAQFDGYKPVQYWNWIRHNSRSLFLTRGLSVFKKGDKVKKPLVFTHRATRLFAINLILAALWFVLSGLIAANSVVLFIVLLLAVNYLIPLNMLLATVIAYPMEMSIQRRYYREAQAKIRAMRELVVIGITGSYGKTSTKYFVNTILSEKYNTLMTPESYNTPMGITRVIREQLNEQHEVFVCEMGARNIGDIKELGELASPSIGILTSIGLQHLETFKAIENVAKTKYELIEALPSDGIAVFNGDNSYCYELAKKTSLEKYVYGIENKGQDISLTAGDIVNSREGLRFRISGGDGLDFECRTALLGKHNVSNILAAVCVALKLGLTAEQIRAGIAKLKPVPHRLELIPTNNGVTVIDDAFNSNPAGAREALETVRELTEGNRIVITPGMVELGTAEYEENKKFGRLMADCCDYAVLIGPKRTRAIVEGLKEGGFRNDRIIVTASLDEATAVMGRLVKAGDVVLFENDLPDNYNE